MAKFIEIEQDGKVATINPENVILVVPTTLIGLSQIVCVGGAGVTVKGSVQEVTAKLEGKSILALEDLTLALSSEGADPGEVFILDLFNSA